MFENFSRQSLVGWIMSVIGFAGLFGIDLPAEQIESLLTQITDNVFALYMAVVGPTMLWFRKISDSPLASGVMGYFGKRETPVPKTKRKIV